MLGFKRTSDVDDTHCLLKDVGINAINRQHLRLASYAVEFNQIVDDLSGREPTNDDWRRFDALFGKVSRFVQTHFRDEEQLMLAHGYPGFTAHKQMHEKFVAQLIDVQSKINDRKVEFKDRFGSMLWNWLKHHINEEDYKYREFFRQQGLE